MLHLLASAQAADPGLFTPAALIALLTLTLLEIVLGIDNIVFIAILCARLPEHQRAKARQIGLALALITRIAFLSTITLIIRAAGTELFTIPYFTEPAPQGSESQARIPLSISGRDLILILGGLFLLWKAVHEIHAKIEGPKQPAAAPALASALTTDAQAAPTKPIIKYPSFNAIIAQILLIDIVFSIDSVITAVGMAQQLWVMITAVIISVLIMMIAAGPIAAVIEKHPTLKILALSFLMLIGIILVADGFGQHIPKGYIYFSMAFALAVEMINIKVRARTLAMP